MKPEDIKMWDWGRIFLGEVPQEFLLEVIFRVAVVYLILMVSMRILGKRMAAQLTRNELAAMVSLAAAIGVPILAPNRGILPPVIIAFVVVAISKTVATISSRNQKIEALTHGKVDTLVKDGVLDQKAMMKTRISKERIMAGLRSENVFHLGEVKRLFFEANGSFTLVREERPRPGLTVIPDTDEEFLNELKPDGQLVCAVCGNINKNNEKKRVCKNCHHVQWVAALETGVDRRAVNVN